MIQQKMKECISWSVWGLLAVGLVVLPACTFWGEKKPQLLVINVLSKELFDDCHIAHSMSVPFEQVEQKAVEWDKNAEIIFYCSNYRCTASGHAARMLAKMGFSKVFVYDAGMAQWYQQGLPVEGPCKEGYLAKKLEPPVERELGVMLIDTENLMAKIEAYKNREKAA